MPTCNVYVVLEGIYNNRILTQQQQRFTLFTLKTSNNNKFWELSCLAYQENEFSKRNR